MPHYLHTEEGASLVLGASLFKTGVARAKKKGVVISKDIAGVTYFNLSAITGNFEDVEFIDNFSPVKRPLKVTYTEEKYQQTFDF